MADEKCPVCGWDLTDEAKCVRVGDRTVHVCCDECAEKLSADSASDATTR